MFLRIDRLQIELPQPTKADPNSAAALQELLGSKFGEMSTLNNYFFQSFNFREKSKLKPFYSLVASITAEEFGHVELVTNGKSSNSVNANAPSVYVPNDSNC
jgi:Mn-containing catalase